MTMFGTKEARHKGGVTWQSSEASGSKKQLSDKQYDVSCVISMTLEVPAPIDPTLCQRALDIS